MQKTKGESKCLILQNIRRSLRSLRTWKTFAIGVVSTVIDMTKKIFITTKAVFGKLTAVNAVRSKKTLKRDQGNIDPAKGVVA